MSKTVNKSERGGARYGGIITSIIIFLLLILGILGINLYGTLQIDKNETALNAAGQMRDLTQSMTKDLYSMKLSYGDDPNSPYIDATLKRLAQNSKKFTEGVDAFDLGGTVSNYAGNQVKVSPLILPSERQELAKVSSEWSEFGALIDAYVPSAKDVTADATPLDLSILKAQESSLVMYNALDRLVNSIHARADEQSDLLGIVQIVGIAAVVLYFIIFMFYFMRKLRGADRVATEARKETDEIMATVNEGLFLVDKDMQIGGQYSASLEPLMGQTKIANRPLDDLLAALVSQKDLETSKSFITQLFNDKVKAKLIKDLNPLDRVEAQVADEKGVLSSRYLNFQFSRVYEGVDIKRVLVGVSDITPSVLLEQQLEREQEQNNQQMEMLTSILHADSAMLNGFLEHSKDSSERVNNILKRPSKDQIALNTKAKEIFREVHGLKGEASALGLGRFVSITSDFEDKLEALKNSTSLSGNDFLPMTVTLDQLIEETKRVEALLKRLGSYSSLQDATSTQTINNVSAANSATDTLTPHFSQYVEKVAERNEKKVKLNTAGLDKLSANDALSNKLNEIIVQLLRNSVVHGIESPEERQAKGKNATGQLDIKFDQSDVTQEVFLSVSDDGRGIDYASIRKKLVAEGVCNSDEANKMTKQQLIMLMFDGGFSTASEATEDAGRGVGLDVIKARVDELNGKIQVQTKPNQMTRFIIRLPLKSVR